MPAHYVLYNAAVTETPCQGGVIYNRAVGCVDLAGMGNKLSKGVGVGAGTDHIRRRRRSEK